LKYLFKNKNNLDWEAVEPVVEITTTVIDGQTLAIFRWGREGSGIK